METLFSAPPEIAVQAWETYCIALVAIFIVLLGLTVAAIVFAYRASARRLRVYRASDVLQPYTPLRALLLSAAGGLLMAGCAAALASIQLNNIMAVVSCILGVFLAMLLLSALLGYATIVFVPGLTPHAFRYRPAPFQYKKQTQ